MLEYLAIRITTPEIEQAVTEYCVHFPMYDIGNYIIYDSNMDCFLIERISNGELDLVIPTLELFKEALLMISFGITIDEINEKLNA